MKRNLGRGERVIRVLIAIVAMASWFFGAVAGTVGILVGVVAIALLGTSAAASCPLHQVMGINTVSAKEKKERDAAGISYPGSTNQSELK